MATASAARPIEYRVTNRGGQGIINIETSDRNGDVIAAFPVTEHDQIMLVTDQGKVIRIPVDGIRIAGRNTQGVTLFNTDKNEHVVSVARLEGAADIDDDELDDDQTSEDGQTADNVQTTDDGQTEDDDSADQESDNASKDEAPPDSS